MFAADLILQGGYLSLVVILTGVVVSLYFARWSILHRFRLVRRWRRLPQFPVLNLEGNDYKGAIDTYFNNLAPSLEYGREHYRDTGFQLWTPEGYMLILPEIMTNDTRLAHEDVVDPIPLSRGLFGDTPFSTIRQTHLLSAIRSNLISKLGPLVPDIAIRVQEAVMGQLGHPKEWYGTNAWKFLGRTVAETSARTFVGDELAQDPEWLQICLEYTSYLGMAGRDLRTKSWLGRKLAVHFTLSEPLRKWRAYRQKIFMKLKPHLEARTEAMKSPDFKKPNDAIQWVIDSAAASKAHLSIEEQADSQMTLIFAAIVTSTSASMTAIYDLLSQPHYIAPLVEEVDRVWEESHGQMSTAALAKMTKLDSFMTETQRVNGLSSMQGFREVTAPGGLTYKNGIHLPQGTVYCFSVDLISKDPRAFEDPEKFDAFRFSEMRAANPDDAGKYYFTSTGPKHLIFGHGRFACPGRFFAATEIKMILITLLRFYELKPMGNRPRGAAFVGNTLADKTKDITVKYREIPAK